MNLSTEQQRAIEFVAEKSRGLPLDRSLRVTLNFHPDRISSGLLILDTLAESNTYKSQYETMTSNGGLTAHPGGDRWSWESRMFGTAYDTAKPSERPKYGSLNYKQSVYGGSPRFGSSYFRLTAAYSERVTFCYPDSAFEPENFGVADKFHLIDLAVAEKRDVLDDYIEAQVHGTLTISNDMEALVLDECYKGSEVEVAAQKLACAIEWRPGFKLTVENLKLYPEYRGEEYVQLGLSLAQDGVLDAKIVGEASRTGKYDSQDLKKLWHYIARFGVLS